MWAIRTPSRRLTREPALLVVPFVAAGLVIAAVPPSPSRPQPVAEVEAATTRPLPPPLLPDMVALRARDISMEVVDGHRLVRFESGLANVGSGPMEVRPNRARRCPPTQRHASQIIYRDVDGNGRFRRAVDTRISHRSAGCMVFHPQHHHWHFEAAARYLLYRPTRVNNALVRARKTSFCLRDSEPVPPALGTFHTRPYYGDCARDTPQGITRGWVDVYEAYLQGQSLRLPDRLPDGVYCLGIRVDPRDELLESDETNNRSASAVRLHGNRVRLARTEACKVPPPPPPPPTVAAGGGDASPEWR